MTFFNIFSKTKEQKEIKKIPVIIDNREKNSLVTSELIKLNNKIQFEQLQIGDYIIGDIAIERKTYPDLINSIINKRIFDQLENLKKYPNQLLIIEQDKTSKINMNENAIRGFILNTAIKSKIPIIFSKDEEDTAKYLNLLTINKEQKKLSIRPSKNSVSKEEQIQFILEGFPGVGPKKAEDLIKEFKNLKNISNASIEQLEKILEKRAKEMYSLFNQEL
jgi:Fanconi anemia group M protein